MIAREHLLPYLITSAVIMLAPGPSVMFTIARAVAYGRLMSFLTVLGNAAGMLVLSAFIALGLGPVLQSSKLLFSVVQWLGGFYLVWLGIDAIRHRVVHAAGMTEQVATAPTRWQTVRQGFVVGILNPKALVYFAAALPQFVDPEVGPIWLQLFTLGALFCLLAVISDGTYGILAGTLRERLAAAPERLVQLRVVGGLVMIGLGVFIIATTPLPW